MLSVSAGASTVAGKVNAADIYYLSQPVAMWVWPSGPTLKFAPPVPYDSGCSFTKLMLGTPSSDIE